MDEMKKRGATPNKSLFRRIAESEFFHNYKRSPSAIVGTVIVVLVLFIALFGPLFAPQNPYDVASLSLTDSYKPPAWEAGGDARFIFGTDSQGRDIFSSLIYGSRISLFIGVVGTLLACAVGITLGLISGYFGGRVDAVIMRLADILLSFPDILVALFIMTMFGRGVSKLLVVFTIIGCVTYVRTVRAEVLTVKQMEYVDAARVIGIPNILIIAKHVLPNVMTTVIVISTMKVGGLILAEATLSFLGAGVPVTEPSLGMLVKNGFDVLFSGYWWIAVMPGLYIMLIVFGINLLGDFLRDEFNPKLVKEQGASLILITHDLAVVSQMADRIIVMYCGKIVESGSRDDVIHRPSHPYTEGLLNSIPRMGEEQKRLESIPGMVPSMLDLPQGCYFAPRCKYCQDICRTVTPENHEVSPGHCAACHFPLTGGESHE